MDRLEPHRRTVIEPIDPIGAERVSLGDAGGRCLSAPGRAQRAAPPFVCSAIDGCAVRHAGDPGPVEPRVGEVRHALVTIGGASVGEGSPSARPVAFEVLARPALLRLAGAARIDRPRAWLPEGEMVETWLLGE